MNKNQLITSFIRKKIGLSEAVELLMEDRIPALVQKYSGTKTVKTTEHIGEISSTGASYWTGEPSLVAAAKIVTGVKPKVGEATIPKLHTYHDSMMEEELENLGSYRDVGDTHARHVIEKIAEFDPTPNKEYTERMVHWYSRSSDSPKVFAPHPDALQHSEKIRKQIADSPKMAITYGKMFGYEGSDQTEAHSVVGKVLEKQKEVHKQLEDAHQQLRDRMDASHPQYRFRSEDFGRARAALETYHRAKRLPNFPKEFKDINKINSLHHLEKIVEPFTEYRTGGEIKKEGATNLYEDDDISVHHIKTHEAGCSYGGGTRWCFTGSGTHGQGIFKSYDSTSPLIVITDKKNKFRNPNEQPGDRPPGNRYALHFGFKRADEGVPDMRFSSQKMPQHSEGHQLMDEGDRAVDPDELARTFPQLRKVPAFLHQSMHVFQPSSNTDTMQKKIAYGEVKVPDILKHIHSFPELHRTLSHTTRVDFKPKTEHYDSAHAYLIGMMHKYAHPDHPVMTHFFGGSKEGVEPAASHEEQAKFLSLMNNYKSHSRDDVHQQPNPFFRHFTLAHVKRLEINPHITSDPHLDFAVKRIMEQSHDSKLHRILFNNLIRTGQKDPNAYRHILKNTKDMSIIRDALDAAKEEKISARPKGDWSFNPLGTDSHDVHKHIATNPHVPDDILWHIASTKIPHNHESLMAITNLIKRRSENAQNNT